MRCAFGIAIVALLVSSGCMGAAKPGPGSSRPYTVRGQQYVPLGSALGYVEEAIASWYGARFHGRLTANGERFDMYAYTAAHKTLPMNACVRVALAEDAHRSVVVRINDRGPFSRERILDLSKAAADELGMVERGTAKVRAMALGTAIDGACPGQPERSALSVLGSSMLRGVLLRF